MYDDSLNSLFRFPEIRGPDRELAEAGDGAEHDDVHVLVHHAGRLPQRGGRLR